MLARATKTVLALTLILAANLLLGGCGPDPIVGRWQAGMNGINLYLDVKPDGSGTFDTKDLDAQFQTLMNQVQSNPLAAGLGQAQLNQVKVGLEQLKAAKVKWNKAGALYEFNMGGAPRLPARMTFKLEGDNLTPVDKAGKPTVGQGGAYSFARTKAGS